SWCAGLPNEMRGSFDVVVSNPPYIAVDDSEIDDSVRLYEPHTALFSGSDGLRDIRVLANEIPKWLSPGGMFIVEMGYNQSEQVRDIFVDAGFVGVVTHSDLAEKPRFTAGFLPR
ncbi:MAG: N5-glutamine methyltransferase family protein, partial [Acidimicrobiaceae bacterium]